MNGSSGEKFNGKSIILTLLFPSSSLPQPSIIITALTTLSITLTTLPHPRPSTHSSARRRGCRYSAATRHTSSTGGRETQIHTPRSPLKSIANTITTSHHQHYHHQQYHHHSHHQAVIKFVGYYNVTWSISRQRSRVTHALYLSSQEGERE